jgi:hypothetical protein
LFRSPKRWSISPWHCSQSFGPIETRMNSYHYLLETLKIASSGAKIAWFNQTP